MNGGCKMRDYISDARSMGFTDAALLPVCELVVVPEYRKFCEQNICGKYGVLPACPPMCGSVEEMGRTMQKYETALVLMMGAGPWKKSSCMSAYCVDAQKMADAVHMKCWADDGKVRYFSLILF